MWRLSMFLLCLIAALSGAPLRQAEAASDLARSLDELGDGNIIETIDGGVGDDKEASILKAGDAHALAAAISPEMADVDLASPTSVSSLAMIGGRRPADVRGFLPASTARRIAWLQCYLF